VHPKANPLVLARLDEAILCAKTRHSEDEIIAGAKALGIENILPEPHT
jgi:hypothetical protein